MKRISMLTLRPYEQQSETENIREIVNYSQEFINFAKVNYEC